MTTESNPPLTELAGAIAAAIINVLQHQLGPLDVNAHELVHGITAELAQLYAENERLKDENERLKAENARLQSLVNNAKDQFDDMVKICKGDQ